MSYKPPFDIKWVGDSDKKDSGCVSINVFCKEKEKQEDYPKKRYAEEGSYSVDKENNLRKMQYEEDYSREKESYREPKKIYEKCEDRREKPENPGCVTINIYCIRKQGD